MTVVTLFDAQACIAFSMSDRASRITKSNVVESLKVILFCKIFEVV